MFSLNESNSREVCINSIYVFKPQKRAERSETTTFFKVDPKERRRRINIIQPKRSGDNVGVQRLQPVG